MGSALSEFPPVCLLLGSTSGASTRRAGPLHPCSRQFPTAAPALAHTHGTRSNLRRDSGSALPAGSAQARPWRELCTYTTWEKLGQDPGHPTWTTGGYPGVGRTEFQHELPKCPPGMGIPTLRGGRSNSGPCIWLYGLGLKWLQPLHWIKSQSTTGNCLWTARPIPHPGKGQHSHSSFPKRPSCSNLESPEFSTRQRTRSCSRCSAMPGLQRHVGTAGSAQTRSRCPRVPPNPAAHPKARLDGAWDSLGCGRCRERDGL